MFQFSTPQIATLSWLTGMNQSPAVQEAKKNGKIGSVRVSRMTVMMFFVLLLICLRANTTPGFVPLQDSSIGTEIRSTGSKVVEIWAPGITKRVSLEKLSAVDAQAIKRAAWPENSREKMTAILNRFEVDYCRQHALKSCEISTTASRGSAVIVDNNRLVTVAHNFSLAGFGVEARLNMFEEKWAGLMQNPATRLQAQSEIEMFKRDPLQDSLFFLTDSTGKIIFESPKQLSRFDKFKGRVPKGKIDFSDCPAANVRDGAGKCRLKVSLELSEIQNVAKTSDFISQDHAVVTLQGKYPSIELSEKPCRRGERVFNVGYPSKSQGREKAGTRNAADRKLSAAQGQILDDNQIRFRGKGWSRINFFVDGLSNDADRPLFSDADSTPGLSGGAILNESGKLCGIVAGNLPSADEFFERDEATKVWLRYSYGPNIQDILRDIQPQTEIRPKSTKQTAVK